jgi:hypothetical protein
MPPKAFSLAAIKEVGIILNPRHIATIVATFVTNVFPVPGDP